MVVRIASASAKSVFELPFVCSSCGASLVADVEGSGTYTSAVAPHQLALEEGAVAVARADAEAALQRAPCPRCGGANVTLLVAVRAHETRRASRRKLQNVVTAVGGVFTLATAAGCATLYTSVAKAAPGVGIWVVFWGGLTVGVRLALGSGVAPPSTPVRSERVKFRG